MGLNKKINVVLYRTSDDKMDRLTETFFGDFVALSFFFVLGPKYADDDDFKDRCIKASKEIWDLGFPNSIKDLKYTTDFHFRGKISKPLLTTIYHYIKGNDFPEGMVL